MGTLHGHSLTHTSLLFILKFRLHITRSSEGFNENIIRLHILEKKRKKVGLKDKKAQY